MPGHALFITHTHPLPDLDGASLRSLRLMQIMRELGWEVCNLSAGRAFHPLYEARIEEARTLLSTVGVEAVGPTSPLAYLADHGAAFDLIVLAVTPGQPDFLSQVRRWAPRAAVIYDTIELTFVSMHRAGQLQRSERLLQQARAVAEKQLTVIADADVTWVVTDEEKALLEQLRPQARVRVISNVHNVVKEAPGPEGRRDLLFVGNYVHMPNRDAVRHFVADIWPQVRAQLPGAAVRFVGLLVPEVAALQASNVLVTGHVADLKPLYVSSRVSIAPLRFGAGVKGKVLEAMGYGLPVVMTPVAAEGTHAVHGEHALIAETPAAFVEAVVALYNDDALWLRLSEGGRRLVEKCFSYSAVKTQLAALLSEIGRG
ncbi:MAG: glycosyltransferase family 4 protein [Caldilinea sp.]|nr:glycosyltransferase family 4 protein [Caldilinea sp.]MDW8441442.1 glycosyltransferase family 4 protein [Caldilineaceae bacterium]